MIPCIQNKINKIMRYDQYDCISFFYSDIYPPISLMLLLVVGGILTPQSFENCDPEIMVEKSVDIRHSRIAQKNLKETFDIRESPLDK